MARNYTPGVEVNEIDKSLTIQQAAASNVGLVIAAEWGPCNEIKIVPYEADLVRQFGKPIIETNEKSWMAAAEFMKGYGDTGHVVRAIDDDAANSNNASLIVNTDATILSAWQTLNGVSKPLKINADDSDPTVSLQPITRLTCAAITAFAVEGDISGDGVDGNNGVGKVVYIDSTNKYLYVNIISGAFVSGKGIDNANPYVADETTITTNDGATFDQVALFYAKYPGTVGNDIKIAMTDSSSFDSANIVGATTFAEEFDTVPCIILELADASSFSVGDSVTTSADAKVGKVIRKDGNFIYVEQTTGVSFVATDAIDNASPFVSAETTVSTVYNEIAIVVLFEDEIVERHIVSTYANSKDIAGNAHFIEDYLENFSNYINCVADESGNITISNFVGSFEATALTGGKSDFDVSDVQTAYDIIFNDEEYDIRLIGDFHDLGVADVKTLQGYLRAKGDLSTNHLSIITLPTSIINVSSFNISTVTTHLASVIGTSYVAAFDNWKKVYDKYNKKRYFIPCTGDVLGAIVRTIDTKSIWSAPFGNEKGLIVNVEKLYHKTTETIRDSLYKNGINSIFFKRGKGYLIWGQKTMANAASSRSRINVRLNLIDIKLAIAGLLDEYISYESNEETWRMIRNDVDEGYLKPREGKGAFDTTNGPGYNFKCDSDNNTPDVIDAYKIVCDLAVKPIKSAERIILNINIVSSGTNISEI